MLHCQVCHSVRYRADWLRVGDGYICRGCASAEIARLQNEARLEFEATLQTPGSAEKTRADGVLDRQKTTLWTTRPIVFPNGARLAHRDGRPLKIIVALAETRGAEVDWEHVYDTREAAEAEGK